MGPNFLTFKMSVSQRNFEKCHVQPVLIRRDIRAEVLNDFCVIYLSTQTFKENSKLEFFTSCINSFGKYPKFNSCFHSRHFHSTEVSDNEMYGFAMKIFLHV